MQQPIQKAPLNQISSVILDSAITVHKEMGPGLLESVYQHCMVKELMSRELKVYTMVQVPLHYKGEMLNKDFIYSWRMRLFWN